MWWISIGADDWSCEYWYDSANKMSVRVSLQGYLTELRPHAIGSRYAGPDAQEGGFDVEDEMDALRAIQLIGLRAQKDGITKAWNSARERPIRLRRERERNTNESQVSLLNVLPPSHKRARREDKDIDASVSTFGCFRGRPQKRIRCGPQHSDPRRMGGAICGRASIVCAAPQLIEQGLSRLVLPPAPAPLPSAARRRQSATTGTMTTAPMQTKKSRAPPPEGRTLLSLGLQASRHICDSGLEFCAATFNPLTTRMFTHCVHRRGPGKSRSKITVYAYMEDLMPLHRRWHTSFRNIEVIVHFGVSQIPASPASDTYCAPLCGPRLKRLRQELPPRYAEKDQRRTGSPLPSIARFDAEAYRGGVVLGVQREQLDLVGGLYGLMKAACKGRELKEEKKREKVLPSNGVPARMRYHATYFWQLIAQSAEAFGGDGLLQSINRRRKEHEMKDRVMNNTTAAPAYFMHVVDPFGAVDGLGEYWYGEANNMSASVSLRGSERAERGHRISRVGR
ncbi:hypothetical protein FB451DRAFT_1189087 [Mycena latifolia]|nr:hypothetical protein FB451DRAFT_1189087 [Mycena latifolia]